MQTIYCYVSEVKVQLTVHTSSENEQFYGDKYTSHHNTFTYCESVINKNFFTAFPKNSFTAFVGNAKITYYHSQTKTMFSMDKISLNHHQILKTFKFNI